MEKSVEKYKIRIGKYKDGEYSVAASLAAAGVNIEGITYLGGIKAKKQNEYDYIKIGVRYSFEWLKYGNPTITTSFGVYLIEDNTVHANDERYYEHYFDKNGFPLGRMFFNISESVSGQIIRDVIIARSQLETGPQSRFQYYCELDDLPDGIEVVE